MRDDDGLGTLDWMMIAFILLAIGGVLYVAQGTW